MCRRSDGREAEERVIGAAQRMHRNPRNRVQLMLALGAEEKRMAMLEEEPAKPIILVAVAKSVRCARWRRPTVPTPPLNQACRLRAT